MDSYGHYGNWGMDNDAYVDHGAAPHIRPTSRGERYDTVNPYSHHRHDLDRYPPRQQWHDFTFSRPPSASSSRQQLGTMKDPGEKQGYVSQFRQEEEEEERRNKSRARKSLRRILRRFAENSSMQGPSNIINSTWWLSRTLWTIFLLVAIGTMIYHLVYLIQTFFDWPIKNKIELGFSSLEFPAVTVCNVNPVRMAKLQDFSADFRDLVLKVQPASLGSVIDKLPPPTKRRRRRQTNSTSDESKTIDNVDYGVNTTNYTNAREDVDDNFYQNLAGYGDTWESESTESRFYKMAREIRELYATEKRATRIDAGHRIEDMLISCSFAGRTCHPRNFTRITSNTYGNCYTLQYGKFISRQSGPHGGLELLLFLDTEEYIRGIAPDDGIQVTIHPRQTLPFPFDEGLAVSAATQTLLSLKMIQVKRKGYPYSQCTDVGGYMETYGIEYTRQTCQKFCEQTTVQEACNCKDETAEDLNRYINTTSYKPCRKKEELECLFRVRWEYQQGLVPCNCDNPCREFKYEKSMSFRPWPHKDYAEDILLKTVCRHVTEAKCKKLEAKDINQLSREFLKLNIFYEDLNFESITEEPDYESVQFISDIGGTLGLWIGLSVLGIMEVFQLAVEVARYLFCCRWTPRSRSVNAGSD